MRVTLLMKIVVVMVSEWLGRKVGMVTPKGREKVWGGVSSRGGRGRGGGEGVRRRRWWERRW